LKLNSLTTDQQIVWSNPAAGYLIIAYYGSYQGGGLWVSNDAAGLDNNSAKSNGVLRDPAAWYHIVYSRPHGGNGTLYINGIAQTIQSINTANIDFFADSNRAIGRRSDNNTRYANCMLADFHCIDGQALTPTSFGEFSATTGVWMPKAYTGTYGTNGFRLTFADNSAATATTLGKDAAGSNNWTPNNFSVTAGAGNDSMIDTQTPYADGGNGRGNYCTWNPLDKSSQVTLTNGNLNATSTVADWRAVAGTFGMSTGKWYWEVTVTGATYHLIGIAKAGVNFASYVGSDANGWGYYAQSGTYNNGSYINTSTFASYTTGDVIGVAFDASAGSLYFYKNGTAQNSGNAAYTGLTSGPYFPATSHFSSTSSDANFGQRPFAYTPPSGFVALNTQNLPEPSIKKPSSYFDTLIYTGDGSTTRSITGLSFSPDLLWHKSRSSADDHRLMDSVRAGGTDLSSKTLFSNLTSAEDTSGSGYVTQTSSGFNLGVGASPYNVNTRTYVAWCWDESATPGFDIVTYTGNGTARTIAHSLGVAPSWMVVKRRDAAEDWGVYHVSMGNGNYMYLNGTQGSTSGSVWNNTTPTSSVFSVGTSSVVNANTGTYVAYLWSEVAGFSKFGSYSSNGSSDGPYVHCGFRPKVVWIKKATGTTNVNSGWCIFDSTRSTYNTTSANLRADLSDAESTFSALDFTSTGFKLRVVSIEVNGATSGDTYIFCAWAETPAKYALAR
jgi:hypothetical protein